MAMHIFARKPVASPHTSTVKPAMPVIPVAREIQQAFTKPEYGYDLSTLRIHSDSEESMAINERDDPYEHEADRVADQVMRMHDRTLTKNEVNPTEKPPVVQDGLRSSGPQLGPDDVPPENSTSHN